MLGMKAIGVYTTRPVHEPPADATRGELPDQRLRSDECVLRTSMKPPLDRVAHREWDHGVARRQILWKTCVKAGGKPQPTAAEPAADPEAERTLRGDVDSLWVEGTQARDRAV